MLSEVKAIIDSQIRPLLAGHGGDIKVLELTDDNYVKIRLLGACSNCPGQQQTLENLIEAVLREHTPQIQGVLLDQQVSDELLQQALQIIRTGQRSSNK